jgi:hypothetical protein
VIIKAAINEAKECGIQFYTFTDQPIDKLPLNAEYSPLKFHDQ